MHKKYRIGRWLALLVLATLLGCNRVSAPAAPSDAASAPTDEQHRDRSESNVDAECEELIRSLKSSKPPATSYEELEPQIPPHHVVEIMHKLRGHEVKAFPALIRHLEDTDFAYSTTTSGGPGVFSHTAVGDIFRTIVDDLVDLIPCPSWPNPYEYFKDRDMAAWWQVHHKDTLQEMRMEALRWAMDCLKKNDSEQPEEGSHYLALLRQVEREVETNPEYASSHEKVYLEQPYQDPSLEETASGSDRQEGSSDATIDAQCETLIRSLRFATRPATCVEDLMGSTPTCVVEVMHRLRSHEVKAFPALIKHLDDTGFVYSKQPMGCSGAGTVWHMTVGDICRRIVDDLVDIVPCPARYERDRTGYFWEHDMVAWWQKHKGKTLREMRLEALRWAIQREREIGFASSEEETRYLEPLLAVQREVETDPDYASPDERTYTVYGYAGLPDDQDSPATY